MLPDRAAHEFPVQFKPMRGARYQVECDRARRERVMVHLQLKAPYFAMRPQLGIFVVALIRLRGQVN
jgi:hypothetical protein